MPFDPLSSVDFVKMKNVVRKLKLLEKNSEFEGEKIFQVTLLMLTIILSASGLDTTRNDIIVPTPVPEDIQRKSEFNIKDYLAANNNNDEYDFLMSEFNDLTTNNNMNNENFFESPVKRNFRSHHFNSVCFCNKKVCLTFLGTLIRNFKFFLSTFRSMQ